MLGNDPDRPVADLAVRLLGMLNERQRPVPMLTPREWEVLQRLESLTDNEIAAALELTKAGVRYHVGNIFAKLEVSGPPERRASCTADWLAAVAVRPREVSICQIGTHQRILGYGLMALSN